MNDYLRPVWLISKRELRDQLRDWRILSPLVLLTVGFPFLMNFFAHEAVGFANQYGGNLIVDRLIPFSVLIIGFFPITISLLGALESFVGEKERGTIEPLLGTPLDDWQLYLGKLVVGAATPLVSSFLAITIYLVVVSRQELDMPEVSVFAQLFLLTIAHAVLMVSAAIVFSIQSTSVKAANLLASFIVIPVALLMQGESALLFWGNDQVLWLAVVAVFIMAGLLVRLGLAHFQREYLLGREIDMLNIRWMARTFWSYFKGEAHFHGEYLLGRENNTLRLRELARTFLGYFKKSGSQSTFDWRFLSVNSSAWKSGKPILAFLRILWAGIPWLWRTFRGYFKGEAHSIFEWYRLSVGGTLRKMWKPTLVLVLLAVVGVWVGYGWATDNLQDYVKGLEPDDIASLQDQLMQAGDLSQVSANLSAPGLFVHNMQATLVIAFFGLFSFSVLGVILYLLNVSVIGLLLGLFKILGYAPLPLVLAGILPHGIFEIPALILSCAVVMRIGLVLVTPNASKTFGEILIEGLADWMRITLGVVMPLLAIAALIEYYVTPRLLAIVLG